MARDIWFYVRDDGKIIKCVDNDGWTFLRNGPERVETVVTAEYVQQNYPAYYENYIKDIVENTGGS